MAAQAKRKSSDWSMGLEAKTRRRAEDVHALPHLKREKREAGEKKGLHRGRSKKEQLRQQNGDIAASRNKIGENLPANSGC